MSFLTRHKTVVALVAVFGIAAGAYSICGFVCPGASCPISSMLGATTAFAGPGCSASAKACDADSKSNVKAASATSADAKACTKEDCVKAIMAEKKISRTEAEAVYAKAVADGGCHGAKSTASLASASSGCSMEKASAQTASASGCSASKASAQTASASGCAGHATNASFANATESKTCGDKEACIAKCMAEKGYTRAQAEECYAKCQSAKASQANVMTGSSYTREAWVDAKVASGLTRAEAEVSAAKAEASGEVKFVNAVQTTGAVGCATAASATGSSCCAKKAAATTAKTEEAAPATTTAASTGGSK